MNESGGRLYDVQIAVRTAYLGTAQARLDAHLVTRVAAWLKDVFGGTSAEQALELSALSTGDIEAPTEARILATDTEMVTTCPAADGHGGRQHG